MNSSKWKAMVDGPAESLTWHTSSRKSAGEMLPVHCVLFKHNNNVIPELDRWVNLGRVKRQAAQ